MKIEHIAMFVNDLEGAKNFFIHYFHAKCSELYHNFKTDFKSYFLSFDGGARLEIMSKPDIVNESPNSLRSGYIHIAFSLGCKEKVDELTLQLKSDGFNIISGPRITGDGYYESCFIGFEGNLIELTI